MTTAAGSSGHTAKLDDPTALTMKQILRENANLREVLEARMDGTDKLVGLLQAALDMRPDVITKEVTHLQKLHEEKFSSIGTQFKERDTRTEQTGKDSKVAVDAALQAAKEAVSEQNKSSALAIAKSEASTNKQLEQIGATIQAVTSSLNDKIDDVKMRLTTFDGLLKGGQTQKDDGRANIALGVSIVVAVLTLGSAFYTVSKSASHESQPQVVYVPAPASAAAAK
jgi:hypothetical protein